MRYRIRITLRVLTVCAVVGFATGCSKQPANVAINQTAEAVDATSVAANEKQLASETLTFKDISAAEHSPFANKETKAVVLIFIATDCPIANYFQPTIAQLATDFASSGVPFFLVHSDPDMDVEAASKHVDEFKLQVPVVLDTDQSIAKKFDAKVTPEAFVVDHKGVIRYRGRINDLYADFGKRRSRPTTNDLRDAIEAVVHGKEVAKSETRAIGCYIPYLKSEVRATELSP